MKKLIFFIFILFMIPVPLESAFSLADKLNGKILLQVEEAGQAWYMYPENKERAFLGRPADAFRIMRELGLGISEYDYFLFNGHAPERLSGRILLRAEANGEAYYVFPDNLKMYYLGRPADAFLIMRERGLGITNDNLNKILVFRKYKESVEQNTQDIAELYKKVSELKSSLPENKYSASQNRIIIRKIGVDAPITEAKSSEDGLSRGMWRVPYASTPDQGSNTVITGHRWKYLPPSKVTFYLLDKIRAGDIVSVIWENKDYYYRVRETKVVHKTATQIQSPSDAPILTLFTCHPIYSTENRLVIIADLITD